ncbi:MAG: hypothetical protein LBI28_05280 [Treponema sp.]|jgi:hypothetical protein|nr:hypothetical protein [Treponema sp.]
MKYIKITSIFLLVLLTFSSCITTKTRLGRECRKEIRTELKKYSDVLDLRRSKVNPYGGEYSLAPTMPSISIGLYVKPIHYNRETLIELSNKLIDFFNNDFFIDNEIVRKWGNGFNVSISFVLKEGEKHNIYYRVEYRGGEWMEKWYEIPYLYRH